MRTRVLVIAVILVTLITGIAWHVTAQAGNPDIIREGEIQLTDEMREWIEARKTIPGVHIGVFDGIRLVLISAGEKPTAGYAITVEDVTGGQAWIIRAKLTGPGGGMVAQVITYPYALVGIKGDMEIPIRVQDAATGQAWPAATEAGGADVETDSGRFAGRIDTMSIEVRLSGVPDEIDPHVFRLSDALSKGFESHGIKEGESFLFRYTVNEHGQKVIVEIVSKL